MISFKEKKLSDSAEKIRSRNRNYVWHPWSPLNVDRSKLTFSHGKGYRVWDIDGKTYIDAASLNLTSGYGHQAVIEAIYKQLLKFHGTDISLASHEPVGLLAERLAKNLPTELSKTLFVNSGSEGIEAAIFIAASYWSQLGKDRSRIISFASGYHGSTFLSRNIGKIPRVSHPFGQPFLITHVELPMTPRELRSAESLERLLKSFEDVLNDNKNASPIAVIVEPFLNVGGAILLPQGFLRGLRELCDKADTLLILDEVFTGYGRTGRMFAFQHEDISPDILVSSKGLASGYMPIAAVTVKEKIYNTFDKDPVIGGLRYGHTTSGHAISCAAALATLEVIESQNLLEKAETYGRALRERFSVYESVGEVEDVRGFGLILVLEMVSPESASKFREYSQAMGLLVRQAGKAIMIVPPLTIDDEGIDKISEILKETLFKGAFLL